MTDPRNRLCEAIQQIMGQRRTDPSSDEISLAVLDITHFSMLNLHLGEQASNQILVSVEKRLQAQPWAHFAIRLSSDEYAILVKNNALTHGISNQPLTTQADCDVAFSRIAELFEQPFDDMRLCFSGGLAPFSNQETPHQWLAQAFVALREAKRLRLINRGMVYRPIYLEMAGSIISNNNEIHAVNDGLKAQSFLLYFQPQWHMITPDQFRLAGVEALVRAERDGKIIGPTQFIGVAEQSGSIVMLGQQVVEMSCRARATLGFEDHHVLSWNISPVQIEMDYNLLALIEFTVQNTGLKRQQVKIEITESEMLNPTTAAFLDGLMKLGYQVAIDDFGTDHAALSVLDKLHADTVKIDKSFLVNVPDDARKTTMLGDLIRMLHRQEVNIIIEGVETMEQVRFLYARQQVTRPLVLQGYLLGRPMDADAMRNLLSDPRPPLEL
ncbi:MAG: EAL domain-containing protein [Marinospirillum sp.]|uniref:GGDEF domain-containing phosphodiesterase n=1 Tax=Marinospirillum sp. TaxID=2183934 RepID=UPI0019E28FA6|nr:GGDEF domain-containing phosphodiesterase [Marinospirillum sp.]MBE0506057.1 EAL domain-containing protein [Marinospirillum sp.]